MKAFGNKRGLIAVLVLATLWVLSSYSQDVVANTPPVACIAEGGGVIEAGGHWEARVTLDGSCSFDADSAPRQTDGGQASVKAVFFRRWFAVRR